MSVTCSPNSRLALKKLTTGCGMCTSDRCGSAAFMRRLAGSWISSDDQCAASATTTKEGTTGKCYPSPEYNLLPITWTVQFMRSDSQYDSHEQPEATYEDPISRIRK